MSERAPPALCEARAVTVRYGGALLDANRDVSLFVAPGEIVALLGENGAGKSTLLHALYGLAPLSGGEVRYGGRRVSPSPERAIAAGIGLVHQHFMLVPPLTVAENVVLGREPRRRWLPLFLDRARANDEVRALGERFGLRIEPGREVADLTVGEAQRVEIIKTLYRGARLLCLDEPTAVLTPAEVAHLFGVLRALVHDPPPGEPRRGILLVTHKLDEVLSIADRIVVMRRGEVVARFRRDEVTKREIAQAMVGREVGETAAPPRAATATAAPTLELRELVVERAGVLRVDRVSLQIAPGEVLGIAGVEGNGQAELCAAIAGLLPLRGGQVLLRGHDVSQKDTADRRRAGLAWVPEDRHRHGLVLDFSIAENLLLGHDRGYLRGGLIIDRARLRAGARQVIAAYDVRPPDPDAAVRGLSGGNQQKLVLGRELQGPLLLLCAQPTRGVDIGAIEVIHARLLFARDAGCAILLCSAELDELQRLSDRIGVLYRGRLVAVLPNSPDRPVSRERLGALMTGAEAA